MNRNQCLHALGITLVFSVTLVVSVTIATVVKLKRANLDWADIIKRAELATYDHVQAKKASSYLNKKI